MIVEGSLAVKAVLLNKKRKIDCIYIDKDKNDRNVAFIGKIAKRDGIKIEYTDRTYIDGLASGKTHGGIIADVTERIFDNSYNPKAKTIFVIDGVEDPFNLAYIFRTLKALGYPDIIMPKRDLSNMDNTLLKSSAGAYDMVNIYLSDDLLADIKKLKNTFKIYALSRSDKAQDLFNYQIERKRVIILGGEKRGIKREILDLCDEELFIPYYSDFRPALNACSALACVATALRYGEKK